LNLSGKSCHSIFSLKPHGFILATTTNEIYLLTTSSTSIQYQAISSNAGMLSSISRRVSSFWAPAPSTNKYPPCIFDGTLDYADDERYFFVISDNMLQKWEVAADGSSKMSNQLDLLHFLKSYRDEISYQETNEIYVVASKNTGSGIVLLMYASVDNKQSLLLGNFQMAGHFDFVINLDCHSLAEQPKLVVPPGSYRANLSTSKTILSIQLSKANQNSARIDFDTGNQFLLGTGYFGTDPVFLCRRNGLISLKVDRHEPIINPFKQRETVQHKQKKMEVEKEEDVLLDVQQSLSQAFKDYSKSEMIYSSERWSAFSVSEVCDAVLTVSETILNSLPATEPRWSSTGAKTTDNLPLLLYNQLKDKEHVHGVYFKFLKVSGVWDEIMQHSSSVKYSLIDQGEKLQCTIALLDLYNDFSGLIDEVIKSSKISGDVITKKDSFFSKVTNIGQFFSALIDLESSLLDDTNVIQQQIENIISVGEILTKSYIACWRYRQIAMEKYNLPADHHVPWTGSPGGINNRHILTKQIKITLEKALGKVDSTKVGSVLTQQVVLLADLLLDAFDKELRISKSKPSVEYDALLDDFQQRRRFIIQSLATMGYIEEAMTLAQKYEDFFMLISLCEQTNDVNKLEQYKVMFREQGFLDVLYNWYMEQGNWGRLLSLKEQSSNEDYSNLLSSHPYLSWIHHIGNDDFGKAAVSLKTLAHEENAFSGRQKMMLVLSNLAALASEEPDVEDHVTGVEHELENIEHQNNILQALGKDLETRPPNKPDDIIEQCLGDNTGVFEECYPSIIHTLNSIQDVTRRMELSTAAWCKCILNDRWEACALLQLNAILGEKLFTKTLQFCLQNDTYKGLIPKFEDIISSAELVNRLKTDQSFYQQLKACYEMLSIS